MKTLAAGLCLALVLIGGPSPLRAEDGLRLPEYRRFQMPNGMTLLLMEQRELPLVSFEFIVRAGSIADPARKEGVASLTAAMLRRGTETRSAADIDSQLDSMGAWLSIEAEHDMTWISAEFLSRDVGPALDILADVLRRPSFPQEELKKLAAQRIDLLRLEKDRPNSVLGQYFDSFLYGRHAYGRPVGGTETSIPRIGLSDIEGFHRSRYTPGNVILAAAGDFESESMRQAIRLRFGAWQARQVTRSRTLAPKKASGRRLLLIDKPDSTQTFFAFGNLGIERTHPDRVHVDVINTLLGGRFTSMLNQELRVRTGLTYGASSSFSLRRHPGPFRISSFTPVESTQRAMDLALGILERLHRDAISTDQLQSAKNYLKGQLPLGFETSDQLARWMAESEFHGLGREEVEGLWKRIDSMTLEDAQRVIRLHFPRRDLVFVLIGKADAIHSSLEKYADQVERRSIADLDD